MKDAHSQRCSIVKHYHQETKHFPDHPARSSGYMDWQNQPAPFRDYLGAPQIKLPLQQQERSLSYQTLYQADLVPAAEVSLNTIAIMLELGMGLSAWKKYGDTQWALRMNPSSGNLHPSECYLVLPECAQQKASVCHYQPYLHVLEETALLNTEQAECFKTLDGFALILTSIAWREAWKYGERAYRYCQLDLGHALGSLRYACQLNGWKMTMLPQVDEHCLDHFLGLENRDRHNSEAEHGACLCWISTKKPHIEKITAWFAAQNTPDYPYPPNRLSEEHIDWTIIHSVQLAARSYAEELELQQPLTSVQQDKIQSSYSAETIIRKRRSAQEYELNSSHITLAVFIHSLAKTLTTQTCPLDIYPHASEVHFAVFVHAVQGLEPGLYMLVRSPLHLTQLQEQCDRNFLWQEVQAGVPLFLLKKGDFRQQAREISCQQAIASDSAYSLAMIARFDKLLSNTPSMYARLFWECGLLGQLLYLEAEAFSMRGTGIGCFFDDQMHELLGLKDQQWQDLYHFTVGKQRDDPRLQTKAPYWHLQRKI
ncbi:SagB/ThcOx family dehydrogenase [Psychromonas ossibalaenae]|uniref:SagB/ThcOx family dehydrogenase n=1 Tax=Psychromonas ossibalaenae TaxID=444922 RepID=UPI00037D5BAF|nr:SagB/ThcOx family dehydrogenase [Psychromonas ossibalaenae]